MPLPKKVIVFEGEIEEKILELRKEFGYNRFSLFFDGSKVHRKHNLVPSQILIYGWRCPSSKKKEEKGKKK